MSGCGCTGQSVINADGDPLNLYLKGTFAGGFRDSFCKFKKTLTVSEIILPNMVVFSENPCLGVGSNFFFINSEKAVCIDTIGDGRYVVTAAPTLVNGKWHVATNANWTTSAATTTFTFETVASFSGCDSQDEEEPLSVKICGASDASINWAGYISTRPINTPASTTAITTKAGAKTVTVTDRRFSPRVGDYMSIASTALIDGNRAIITEIATMGTEKLITLDRPVTGITSAPKSGTTDYCLSATTKVRPIAEFVFDSQACCTYAILDKTQTSAEDFPPGDYVDAGKCGGQEYCFTITDSTPGAEHPVYQGTLLLT